MLCAKDDIFLMKPKVNSFAHAYFDPHKVSGY